MDSIQDAAEVMAEECARRSESRCMTPFFLNPTTCDPNLKCSSNRKKEKPTRGRVGFSVDADESRNKMRDERELLPLTRPRRRCLH